VVSTNRPRGGESPLTTAVVQDVDESTDDVVAPEAPGEATVAAGTDQPEKAEQKKKRKRTRGEAHKENN